MQSIQKHKYIDHPLEDAFGIESGSTVTTYTEHIPAPIVESPMYDDKDNEIETKLEQIYTIALGQSTAAGEQMEMVEGKFKSKLGDVSAEMLSIALGAVREKAQIKMHKDGNAIKTVAANNHTTNNNLIVADRNEILKALLDKPA